MPAIQADSLTVLHSMLKLNGQFLLALQYLIPVVADALQTLSASVARSCATAAPVPSSTACLRPSQQQA